jgi:hypothetical protein
MMNGDEGREGGWECEFPHYLGEWNFPLIRENSQDRETGPVQMGRVELLKTLNPPNHKEIKIK